MHPMSWHELEQLKDVNGAIVTTDWPQVPVDCIYESNPTSSEPLCDLWCEIQTHKGSECIQCPEKYKIDPERILICSLWSELEMINYDIVSAGSITTIVPHQNETCAYSDHLMSSDLLCEVWCKIEATKGLNCIFCPDDYKTDPEAALLCHLWEQLVNIENNPPVTDGSDEELVKCIYEDNLTSSNKLCDVWCDIQAANGSKCLEPCPDIYEQDPESSTLCQLWDDLQIAASEFDA